MIGYLTWLDVMLADIHYWIDRRCEEELQR